MILLLEGLHHLVAFFDQIAWNAVYINFLSGSQTVSVVFISMKKMNFVRREKTDLAHVRNWNIYQAVGKNYIKGVKNWILPYYNHQICIKYMVQNDKFQIEPPCKCIYYFSLNSWRPFLVLLHCFQIHFF